MRKNASILAVALTAVMFSGAAMAADNDPQKKKAADADSSQPVSDTWITTKVKSSLLADSDVAGTKIEVDTVDGVVFLTGNVESQAQVDEAKRIAAEADGVGKVDTTTLQLSAQASRCARLDALAAAPPPTGMQAGRGTHVPRLFFCRMQARGRGGEMPQRPLREDCRTPARPPPTPPTLPDHPGAGSRHPPMTIERKDSRP